MKKMHRIFPLILSTVAGLVCLKEAALGQGLSSDKATASQQLQSLEPEETDLQGFVRYHPADETSLPPVYSESQHKSVQPVLPSGPILDQIQLGVAPERHYVYVDQAGRPLNTPTPERYVSTISRGYFSADGVYDLQVSVTVCASDQFAEEELHFSFDGSQIPWRQLTPADGGPIGNEAWVPVTGRWANVAFRYGRLVVSVRSDVSSAAMNSGTVVTDFPKEAVRAVAYQVLLRASQQTALTGVSAYDARVAMNGHALPKNALLVAGQTYVPVAEFAKAMGLTSQWNTKTGALTLNGTGRKTVALTAGSTAATVGGLKAAALTVPVLKQNGQPVMTLVDLLAVTGGRIVGKSGNTVEVKG